MKKVQQLLNEISALTLEIEQKYPELYLFLDENPQTIPNKNHPAIDTQTLSDYLDSLKQMLTHYIENHSEELEKKPITWE